MIEKIENKIEFIILNKLSHLYQDNSSRFHLHSATSINELTNTVFPSLSKVLP